MAGIIAVALFTAAITVFFRAGIQAVRVTRTSRFPKTRAAFFAAALLLLSDIIPPIRHLSLFQALLLLRAELFDYSWFFFFMGASAFFVYLKYIPGRMYRSCFLAVLGLYAVCMPYLFWQSDISSDTVYTPRPYTVSTLTQLKSECLVTWYRSESFARTAEGLAAYHILREIQRTGGSAMTLVIRDPAQHTSPSFAEDTGLYPLDGARYSGIIVEYRGIYRSIPAAVNRQTLEYDLVCAIEKTAGIRNQNSMRIQMMVLGSPENGYEHLQFILQNAGFTLIPPELPEADLDPQIPLIVIGSHNCNSQTAAAVQTFLERGGSAAFFVSGAIIDISGTWKAAPKSTDPLLALLSDRGVSISGQLLRGKSHYRIIVPSPDGQRPAAVPYPYWIPAERSSLSGQPELFSGIASLQLFWASPLTAREKSYSTLCRTRTDSERENPPFSTAPLRAAGSSTVTRDGPFTVGVTGDSVPRILVFSDEYFISSVIELSASYSNLLFFGNCIEWLTGNSERSVLKRIPSFPFSGYGRLQP